MEIHLQKQLELRVAAITIASIHIFYCTLELILWINERKSSFSFNTRSIDGQNEGTEAELNFTVPSKCVVDALTVLMAIILLVGIIKRKASLLFLWLLYTASRLACEVTVVIQYSLPVTSMQMALWILSGASYIFMCVTGAKICSVAPARQPSLPEQCLEKESPPTYEVVVDSMDKGQGR